MGDYILVIGATLLDTKGKPLAGLEPRTSNPATIRSSRGGTARNVAENLSRLGVEVFLISAVGDDAVGKQLLAQTAVAGVNLEHTLTIPNQNTGSYIALIDPDGSLSVALDDVQAMESITPEYLQEQETLFAEARMVMIDGSLTPETLDTAVSLATKHNIPLCADPSSARLVYKMRPHLPYLQLIVPNAVEAAELCQADPDDDQTDATNLARQLVREGVQIAVVTMPDFSINYATSDETGHIPPRDIEILDSTGSGDAITAAIIFGLINNLPTIEAIRLGTAAADLTSQTVETVVPDLSLDMLYDHLSV